ncbi:MAG: UDP-N-acetylmuramoyl-L-alanine--D-glutamate ligase [Bacteroidales bacterium]|nr:UDP-N-acetylmuramoyl-L-alanine--D-glutamate ligase [Bacteroidales bacterium]MDZ4204621.1 UDP-N-acetylmuramoyl-L-alanine--D-glutamate ligase [Bacteroidales bacterium]
MKRYGIAVLGAGESGTGAAVLAKMKDIPVFLSEKGLIKQEYKNVLSQFDIDFEEGQHSIARILKADEVVKSPGIPDKSSWVVAAKQKGIPVISEIEFAARFTKVPKICITGTNGKTTTTMLTWHMLKRAGMNAGLAGNVGKSFSMQVALERHDIYVLEISSFQLDGMFDFRADIAILTNITPDHLDRYDYRFSNYVNSKFRILQNQTNSDAFIYCADDPVIMAEIGKRPIIARKYPYTLLDSMASVGGYIEKNEIVINTNTEELRMTLEELALQGRHNVYNSMAAGISASLIGLRKETIRQCLSDFQNIEHRLEYVSNVHGIEFINDSKATNVNSTWYALESMVKPVIWIAGGLDKGNDYEVLKELVKSKVKVIVCLGIDNTAIKNAFAHLQCPIVETQAAADAVVESYHAAQPGDVVLLSPACASFDLFENFEDRGNQFKEAVRML